MSKMNITRSMNTKSLHKYCLILFFFFCFIALTQQKALADEGGFDISSYNVDIKIGDNNVYHVNETIIVDFHQPRHGIYRTIPYIQELYWEVDGIRRKYSYNTTVSSIKVLNTNYDVNRQNGNIEIKIGDADKYVSGKVVYKISYDHVLGNDKINSQDFVYYNLIGTNWNCNIDNVSFNVTLPEGFDTSKIEFYSGANHSRNSAPVQYTVNNNIISGTLNGGLKPYGGLTLKIDLPQGYFDTTFTFSWDKVFIISAIIFSVLSLVFLLKHGLDPALVKTVEFYPPNNISPAEAGYIIDSIVDNEDVISLIIYWASKEYLLINQVKTNDFELIKLKELDITHNAYEHYMFNQLFDNRNVVLVSGLKNSFYKTINTTKDKIGEVYKQENRRLFTQKSEKLSSLSLFFSFILFYSTVFYMLYTYGNLTSGGISNIIASLFLSLIITVIILVPFLSYATTLEKLNSLQKGTLVRRFIFNSLFLAAILGGYIYISSLYLSIAVGVVVAISSIFINVMSVYIDKRTPYGNQMLAKLLGFKNFLTVAEKPRIEQLVEQNPSYYYDVLPYAYVLGVTDKWSKKFEDIAMQPPEWYRNGYNTGIFSPYTFQHSLFSSLNQMENYMTSEPSSKGGRGGGFSGGGFGGGGGGSW